MSPIQGVSPSRLANLSITSLPIASKPKPPAKTNFDTVHFGHKPHSHETHHHHDPAHTHEPHSHTHEDGAVCDGHHGHCPAETPAKKKENWFKRTYQGTKDWFRNFYGTLKEDLKRVKHWFSHTMIPDLQKKLKAAQAEITKHFPGIAKLFSSKVKP